MRTKDFEERVHSTHYKDELTDKNFGEYEVKWKFLVSLETQSGYNDVLLGHTGEGCFAKADT